MTGHLWIIRLTNPYYINGCEHFRYVHKIEILFTKTMKFLVLTLWCLSAVSALSFLRKLPNSKPGTYFSYTRPSKVIILLNSEARIVGYKSPALDSFHGKQQYTNTPQMEDISAEEVFIMNSGF
jgi:hypothetical protein